MHTTRMLALAAVFGVAVPAVPLGAPTIPQNVVERAAESASVIQQESKLTGCFFNGYNSIATNGCSGLGEIGKRKLAYAFSYCHLEFAGRTRGQSPCPLDSDAAFAACLSTLDTEHFQAYTTYVTHTDNLCYFIEANAWQENASKIVQNLLLSANDSARVRLTILRSNVCVCI